RHGCVVQRFREDLERRGNDHPEGAHGAGVKLQEVVPTDVLDDAPACAGEAPVRQRNADPDEEVPCGAVAQPQRTGPSRSEQPADGVAGRVEGIEWEKLTALRE